MGRNVLGKTSQNVLGTMNENAQWQDAVLAAVFFAIGPSGFGGVSVKARAGPVRDRWLEMLSDLLKGVDSRADDASAPFRRVPSGVGEGRLLGGLDLTATLRAGRPVPERGLLAEADGGVLLLPGAERMTANTAAILGRAFDSGEVTTEREGIATRSPACFGVVAFDEGLDEDEMPPLSLLDRLAFHVDLSGVPLSEAFGPGVDGDEVAEARALLGDVAVDGDFEHAICASAAALGIVSLRAPLLALRCARAAAALAGRSAVNDADAQVAARLVLGPRATVLPSVEAQEEGPEQDESARAPPEDQTDATDRERGTNQDQNEAREAQDEVPGALGERPLDEVVLEAAQAAIPQGLLERLRMGGPRGPRSSASSGRAGQLQHSLRRGRPIGVRRGEPGAGARLNVVETLRAAAPWQPLRRCERSSHGREHTAEFNVRKIDVRKDDFRVTRFKRKSETTTIFVVDASGSAALHRLAEAKGAVELLLADCYVRRDSVALIAFRAQGAELVLAPTRSLVRAKRSLAGLPGGGGTPIAAGLDAALEVADASRRKGATPVVVVLTDGRANIARDSSPNREAAQSDALDAARRLRASSIASLLIDTSARGRPLARELADAMGATCLPLPRADARRLSDVVRAGVAAHVSNNAPVL